METTLETANAEEFRVWVSTFGLYNNGYLTGYWVDAADAPETVEEFLTGLQERGQTLPANVAAIVGDELHCFDTECSPIRGEMSTRDAREIAAALETYLGVDMPAFLAACRDQHAATAADIERIAIDWDGAFMGYFDTVEDYAVWFLDITGMLDELPDWASHYFDTAAYARDLELGGDISLMQDIEGRSFIYRNF